MRHRRDSPALVCQGVFGACFGASFVVDVFDEVEEQLRSDRYKTLALKALPWIGALTAAVVTAHPASPPRTWALPSVPAPAASVVDAVPITSPPAPGPSASRSAGADARAAGLAGIVPLAPWSPSPSPSLSPSPVLTPAPVTGTLSADVTAADLSSGQQVTITLTASGAPVAWGAWCDDKADVLLSATSGTARPGFPSYLTLSLAPQPDEATATTCHIWPGGFRIAVTLPGPLVPSSAPAPSDTPSPDPSSS